MVQTSLPRLTPANNVKELTSEPSFKKFEPFADYGRIFTAAGVLREFLCGMAYCPSDVPSINEDLETVMRTEMNKRKLGCPQLEKTLHLAASLIEVC